MTAKEILQPFFDVLDTEDVIVFGKRLSANDTGASGAHQAGPYLPNNIAFSLCKSLESGGINPFQEFETEILSHGVSRLNKLIWYNQSSRDECRITRWAEGGRKNSVLQKDLTGGLFVSLFKLHNNQITYAWAWFCKTPEEEDLIEERLGAIEPGTFMFNGHSASEFIKKDKRKPCSKLIESIPKDWFVRFPDGQEIVKLTYNLLADKYSLADQRLLIRRGCEYDIFLAIEKEHVLPKISGGFKTVDSFIELANSVTNRRKSRSGKSFELHLERIFQEDSLPNTRGGRTEGKKSPDFLFPSVEQYLDSSWEPNKLRMLGVKTTCKDRWRQILNEADRIPNKHLITLQEGVSVEQFREMEKSNVTLVVPDALHDKYPKEIRPSLVSLNQFISETKLILHG